MHNCVSAQNLISKVSCSDDTGFCEDEVVEANYEMLRYSSLVESKLKEADSLCLKK